nr:troponin T, skeletal muscle-like [Misgurnus anguillicaudatus]
MAEANIPTNELKIITININGGFMRKLRENEDGFLDFINQYDVIMLQETHLTINNFEEENLGLRPNGSTYPTFYSSRERGVAVIINTEHELIEVFSNEGNYIGVQAKIKNRKYIFVSFYYHQKETRELLSKFLDDIKYKHGVRVIGGDFNVTIEPVWDIKKDNPFHKRRRKMFNPVWPKIYQDVWRKMNPDVRIEEGWTKKTPHTGQLTRLDYFFMKKKDEARVTNCQILEDELPTDHRAVHLILRCDEQKKEEENNDDDEVEGAREGEEEEEEEKGKEVEVEEEEEDEVEEVVVEGEVVEKEELIRVLEIMLHKKNISVGNI